MMSNVPNTTETIGNIRDQRTLFSGQANTRQYSQDEKAKLFKQRENKQLGQDWDNPQVAGILAQDNNN